MNMKIALTTGACLLGLTTAPASAATQIVSNGILTGATGVMVGGVSYDVSFANGTCAQAFGSCDQSKFAFSTLQDATSAAQALLDQVFIDGAQGDFDTAPKNIRFCSSSGLSSCRADVVYNESGVSYFSVIASNSTFESNDRIIGPYSLSKSFNYTNANDRGFAIFALSPISSAVPEPATWAMMMVGFGGMGYAMRRKAKVSTRIRFA